VPITSQYDTTQTEIVLGPGSLAPPSLGTAGNSFVWTGPIAGDWNAAANWTDTSTGATPVAVAPSSHDSVVFNSPITEIQASLGPAHAAAITFNGDDAILGVLTGGTLAQNGSVLDVVAAGATLQAATAQFGFATFPTGAGLTVSDAVARFGTLDFDGDLSTPINVTDGGLVQVDSLALGGVFPVDIVVDATSTLEVGTAGTAAAVQIEAGGELGIYRALGGGQAILFSPAHPGRRS